MDIPSPLLSAIEEARGSYPAQALSAAYEALSLRYRRETAGDDLFIRDETEALAYTSVRLPATYAANRKVFNVLADFLPDFAPQSLCDAGAGPGTSVFAAFDVWGGSLESALLCEPNAPLRALGGRLLKALGLPASYHAARLEAFSPAEKYDLVTASYVLNELPEMVLDDAVRKLWRAAGQALALVEAGTPLGFQTLLKAREILVAEEGTHIAAPCPHSFACPLAAGDNWCHFNVRLQRPALHRAIKPGATLSYEDERFCYLIVTRRETLRPAARIIGAPKGGKVLGLPLCMSDGAFNLHQSSRRDPDYGALKRLEWGDGVEGL